METTSEQMSRFDFAEEHLAIFDRAFQIYKDKSKIRGQMWLEFKPSDKIRELKERIMRIENAYEREQFTAVIEDGIDLINYTAFLIKQVERGQRG